MIIAAAVLAVGCHTWTDREALVPLPVPGSLTDNVPVGIRDSATSSPSLLRSSADKLGARHPGFAWLAPDMLLSGNNGFPYSMNDGAVWSARGTAAAFRAGFLLRRGRVTAVVAPELTYSRNRPWVAFDIPTYYGPEQYPDRSLFSAPWFRLPHSIDQPWRFGEREAGGFNLGESGISMRIANGAAEFGLSNEHEWWGPGRRNAIVLSSNAPGFTHLFLRTARPLPLRTGFVEARWVVGGLSESAYFDTISTNNRRAFSAVAVAWRRQVRGSLEIGLARAAIASAGGWMEIPAHAFDAVLPESPYRLLDSTDIVREDGRDAITSLFTRWSAADGSVSVYGELARQELPRSVRELLLSPNFTRGYTAGFNWRVPPASFGGHFRMEVEATNLELEASILNREGRVWYTSSTVPQGFTHRGQMLGAAIGPGASSQWIAVDYLRGNWLAGVITQRIRWNNDAMYTYFDFPPGTGWCENDVTLAPGLRGGARSRWGRVSAEFQLQKRLNYFFQNSSGCPKGPFRRDLPNKHMSVSWSLR